ncbi:DUF2934 domain-containing protein [Thiobacter aerophilum]|uniref:DUF2934 domain-containing protein n=1 Tax=Thiobacter aerophilum TaxID=3121275 RepID=A0ABV0EGM7_9BURK
MSDPKSASSPPVQVTPEERYRLIAEAAYFRAQRRGFVGGDPVQDWLEAEAEIDRMLAAGALPASVSAKQRFQSQLENQLRELDERIESLKVQASLARLELKSEFQQELDALEGLRNRLRGRLEEIRMQAEGAWEDLKSGAEKAWEDLRQAVERVAKRFR